MGAERSFAVLVEGMAANAANETARMRGKSGR